MFFLPKKHKHKHREAYCLMEYGITNTNMVYSREFIWNSRDGVTPFIVHSEDGAEMIHVNWPNDMYLPHHTLKNGDRYFADMSRDRARFLAKIWVKEHGHWPDYSEDETEFMLAKEYYGDGHIPTLLKFGESAIEYIPKHQQRKP